MNEITNIINFLEEIGIKVIEKELPQDTFLPGITISQNGIEIDFDKLLYPGDILHEAGHIAVTSSNERILIGTDAMPKEWPTQGDEIATMLWSYAALKYLDLPIEFVFHPNGYKNQSDWLIENFSNANYIGLPLLEWMGLTNKDIFPQMTQWLRD
ncbi:MAG: hypothetical protein QM535_13100 [Limnohabitans sp.]|nr:hypothetical protein [Limnohabitans sp.]